MKKLHKIHPAKGDRLPGTLRLPLLLLTGLLGLMLPASPGWSAPEAKAPAAPAAKPEAATPDPGKILQQACDFIKNAKQFSFKAEVTDDRVYTAGKKLQFAFDLEAFVARPDRLRLNAQGDVENKQFFYNGKTITLYDPVPNAYASVEAPGSIDEALDKVYKEYDLRVALSDLAASDPGAAMAKGVKHSLYVGLHQVHGVKCHHLAFDRNDIQWQIWVDAGEKPLIRKLIITQKRFIASPQWTAYFTDWNFTPQLNDNLFVFTPPQGATKAKFVSLKEAPKPAPKPAPQKAKKKGDKS